MAKITIANSAAYNLANLSMTVLANYYYWQHTATSTVFSSNQQNDGTGADPGVTGVYRMEVTGTAFTYLTSPNFVYTAGTIQTLDIMLDGVSLITASALDLDALQITQALQTALLGGADTTLELILQHADSITGNAGSDTLTGLGGADTILGAAGSDSLMGGTENDLLKGQKGKDTLLGGTGDDTLSGSDGADMLTGDAGADQFLFNAKLAKNLDKITDFNNVEDHIALENAIFKKIGAVGSLKTAAYHEGVKAHDASDRIIYDAATGKIFYDADGTGKGKAVLFAMVTPNTDLSSDDFLIV